MTATSPVPGDGPTERERLTEADKHALRTSGSWPNLGRDLFKAVQQIKADAYAAGLAARTPAPSAQAHGEGWFWTQQEWSEWSNRLALLLPEDDVAGNPDGAQESIIEATLAMYVRDRLDAAPTAVPLHVTYGVLLDEHYSMDVYDTADEAREMAAAYSTDEWTAPAVVITTHALDAAPTDPGTRDVVVRVYDEQPGPEVTEVEDLSVVWYRRPDGLWDMRDNPVETPAGHYTWPGLVDLVGPLVPVGTRARLRTPGTEETEG